jgi:hypothetical protein
MGAWILTNMSSINSTVTLLVWVFSKPIIHLVYFYLVLSLWNLRKNSLKIATALYIVEFFRSIAYEIILTPGGYALDNIIGVIGWMILPTIVILYLYTKKDIFVNEELYEGVNTKLWYLLPILSGIIGGLIGYFTIRNSNKKMAKNILIIGTIITIIFILYLTTVFIIFYTGIVGPGHQKSLEYEQKPQWYGFSGIYIRTWNLKSNGDLSFYIENVNTGSDVKIRKVSFQNNSNFQNNSKEIASKDFQLTLVKGEKSDLTNVSAEIKGNKGDEYVIDVSIEFCATEMGYSCDENENYIKSKGTLVGRFS